MLSLYLIAWIANPPPPIPIRVVVSSSYSGADSTQSWQIKGFSELIKNRFLSSQKAFVVMTDDYCPVLDIDGKTDQEIKDNAVRARATWIVNFKPENHSVSVEVLKRSGKTFKLKSEFNTRMPSETRQKNLLNLSASNLEISAKRAMRL